MNQTTLCLDHDACSLPEGSIERIGFDIGWDHARHGLVPPPELLIEGTPLGQGWRTGKAVFGGRTLPAPRSTRQWLALRIGAWRRGIAFETQQLTPHYLSQIESDHCPILRTPLGGAAGQADAPVVERLNRQAGYAAGNVALMSQRAVRAREGVDLIEALRRARRIESGAAPIDGLDAAAWIRLAVLGSMSTTLPFFEAARLPLAVLPPNRVRLLNAPQGLQALLTLQFAAPGWSARTRSIAALLPEHTHRQDFNLFVGAIAPRVLEAETFGPALRWALEDAWLHERVQRRWQHFVHSLGDAGTATLLERAATLGLANVRTLQHESAQATEGWALPDGGRIRRPTRLPLAPMHAPRHPQLAQQAI